MNPTQRRRHNAVPAATPARPQVPAATGASRARTRRALSPSGGRPCTSCLPVLVGTIYPVMTQKMRGNRVVWMLCVAQLLQQAWALPSVTAADILDLQPGEPNGPFWIVSTADSRWPNKMFELEPPSGESAVTQIWVKDFRESERSKYWLYIDKETSPSKRTSAWIVSTCESKHGGEGLYLKSTVPRPSSWKHEPGRPDRKMLWDLIPADNDMRFYIVSNADSRAPNEMLFLNDPGGLSSWPFQEDRQAQWFLKRAPVPGSCYEQPGYIIIVQVCVAVFILGAPICCILCCRGGCTDLPRAFRREHEANPAPVDVAPSQGEAFLLPSSSGQLPLQCEASGNFSTTPFHYAYPASLQGGDNPLVPQDSVQLSLQGETNGNSPTPALSFSTLSFSQPLSA